MKAFRLDGSYDVQIQCTVMFCAGPNGCPPSNCLDSGSNELFVSHGRRKRSILSSNPEEQTAETLSAIIRVLAEGEEERDGDMFYKNGSGYASRQRGCLNRDNQGIQNTCKCCLRGFESNLHGQFLANLDGGIDVSSVCAAQCTDCHMELSIVAE